MLTVEDLEVTYGTGAKRVSAVKGVSFEVFRGGSFGLVGESGSGKSTVLRAIAGLAPVSGGRIQVKGRTLGTVRDARFRKSVQMVFQDPYGSLHPRHTVDRILSEPCAVHGLGDVEPRIERALREVGLGPTFRFRYPHQLSGGQRQRVAIARALMPEPEVLLLDEPTSALDVSVQAEVLNLLSDLRAAKDLTYLFVTHNLAVMAQMCEQVAILNNGRVVETARVGDLARGVLSEPYSRQLLLASKGFDRETARNLVAYD